MSSIIAAVAPINIQGGATWVFQFNFTYKVAGSWGPAGTPIDLTGWSARMHIKTSISSPTALITALSTDTSPHARLVVDGTNGIVSGTVEAVDTATLITNFSTTTVIYGLELFQSVGGVEKVLFPVQGSLIVAPQVVLP